MLSNRGVEEIYETEKYYESDSSAYRSYCMSTDRPDLKDYLVWAGSCKSMDEAKKLVYDKVVEIKQAFAKSDPTLIILSNNLRSDNGIV